jgi:hypothetical protein
VPADAGIPSECFSVASGPTRLHSALEHRRGGMSYETQIEAMKALAETFDSIGYAGVGRQGLARCIAAFEAADKDKALAEYRRTIGAAPNFASALTDLDERAFYTTDGKRFSQMLGVMVTMSMLMNGDAK